MHAVQLNVLQLRRIKAPHRSAEIWATSSEQAEKAFLFRGVSVSRRSPVVSSPVAHDCVVTTLSSAGAPEMDLWVLSIRDSSTRKNNFLSQPDS